MPQSSVKESTTIRFGSGVMEIGDDVGSLVEMGAFRNGAFEERFDKVSIKSDNAGEIYAGIRNHEAALSCDLQEINFDVLAHYMKGVHTLTPNTTTPVPVTGETHILPDTKAVRLNHKNGDGTEVASITVTEGVTARARNTDYVISVDPEGYTCITRTTGGGFADNDVAVVDYTYTPLASRTYTAGGPQTLTAQVVRFTNTNAAGHDLQITVFKATAAEGIKIAFPADDADDVAFTPINMTGTCDTALASGAQLFEIVDEQHV
jgi:hypothetical protein